MPERNEYANGTPSWVDLSTSDPAAAKAFYGGLFGWTYNDLPIDEANNVFYSMAQMKGRDVAAIAPLGEQAEQGVPPHWNSYVSVTDVDATAARVGDAGGTLIMPPFDVMDAGRMAVVQDPTGAIFNIWQAKNNIGAGIVNEPGAFSWSELITPDVKKSAPFYKKLLGWDAEHAPEMQYTEWKLNGESIGGAMAPPMPGMPSVWGIYFMTDDTDATVAKAKSLGGTAIQEPMDIEPGRLAVLADPQGAIFMVIKMKAA